MQHEFPGSILVYGPGSARMAWLAVRSRPCPLAIGLTLGCGRDGRGGRRVEQGQELALSVIALCQATGSSNPNSPFGCSTLTVLNYGEATV
jgi:hypothetical protein